MSDVIILACALLAIAVVSIIIYWVEIRAAKEAFTCSTPPTSAPPVAIASTTTAPTATAPTDTAPTYPFRMEPGWMIRTGNDYRTAKRTTMPDSYNVSFKSGHLMITNKDGSIKWATGTTGFANASMAMTADGNLVIYDAPPEAGSDRFVIWATTIDNFAGATLRFDEVHGVLELVKGDTVKDISTLGVSMTPNITIVPYGKQTGIDTKYANGARLYWTLGAMQVMDGSTILWKSPTTGAGAAFEMLPSGDFVIYDAKDNKIWSAGTGGYDNSVLRFDGNRKMLTIVRNGTVIEQMPRTDTFKASMSTVRNGLTELPNMTIGPDATRVWTENTAIEDASRIRYSKGIVDLVDANKDTIASFGVYIGPAEWRMTMQPDGNLVIYYKKADGTEDPAWAAGTFGYNGAQAYFNMKEVSIDIVHIGKLIKRIGGRVVVDGYDLYDKKDIPGNDIMNMRGSVDELKAKCNEMIDCMGFNTDGWIKKNTMDSMSPSTTVSLYTKRYRTQYSYKSLANADSPGSDISHITGDVATIRRVCDKDPNCKGFNTDGWLKSKIVDTPTASSGMTLYAKQQ